LTSKSTIHPSIHPSIHQSINQSIIIQHNISPHNSPLFTYSRCLGSAVLQILLQSLDQDLRSALLLLKTQRHWGDGIRDTNGKFKGTQLM
jgi:hypothetical protein